MERVKYDSRKKGSVQGKEISAPMLIIFHYSTELPQMLKGGGCLGCMEISFPPGTRGAGCCHYTQMSFPLLASSSNLSTTLSRNQAAWAQQGFREKLRWRGLLPWAPDGLPCLSSPSDPPCTGQGPGRSSQPGDSGTGRRTGAGRGEAGTAAGVCGRKDG